MQNASCQASNKSNLGVKVDNWYYIESGDAEQMKAALNHGPIAIAVNASDNFMAYSSGIFNSDDPNASRNLNHAVVLVGYGREDNTDYFILRNSWGTGWGESGYMRIENDGTTNGVNGINLEPLIPYASGASLFAMGVSLAAAAFALAF